MPATIFSQLIANFFQVWTYAISFFIEKPLQQSAFNHLILNSQVEGKKLVQHIIEAQLFWQS